MIFFYFWVRGIIITLFCLFISRRKIRSVFFPFVCNYRDRNSTGTSSNFLSFCLLSFLIKLFNYSYAFCYYQLRKRYYYVPKRMFLQKKKKHLRAYLPTYLSTYQINPINAINNNNKEQERKKKLIKKLSQSSPSSIFFLISSPLFITIIIYIQILRGGQLLCFFFIKPNLNNKNLLFLHPMLFINKEFLLSISNHCATYHHQ